MPRPNRRSPRWRVHDYRWAGLYFVTICTADRRAVLGEVVDGAWVPSPLGRVAGEEWDQVGTLRPEVVPDAFVVMPNHVHALFGLFDPIAAPATDHRDMIHHVPTPVYVPISVDADRRGTAPGQPLRQFGRPLARSVSSIVAAYKAAVTRRARRLGLWPDGPLWQGRFHDRVVRDDREADRIRRYIHENPARWPGDRFHPDRLPPARRRRP